PVPATAPVKLTGVVGALLHNTWLFTVAALGVGFTVMVKDFCAPVQLFAEGVTVILAIAGTLVVFSAVNDGMLPLPEAARPIAVLSFVQVKAVPGIMPAKFTTPVCAPLHTAWFAGVPAVATSNTDITLVVVAVPHVPLTV